MSSRDQILARVKSNQPSSSALPDIAIETNGKDLLSSFKQVLDILHVSVHEINSFDEIIHFLPGSGRIATTLEGLPADIEKLNDYAGDPHELENVELAILPGSFAVAENGAIWINNTNMGHRVLPFIAQQLALVVSRKDILANMHEAYDRIAGSDYGFGVFIAGPSKTADIEQSLVLGAHGPKSMMVFILS